MSKLANALTHVKAYCAARIPAGLKSDHIHGIDSAVLPLEKLIALGDKPQPVLLVSDLQAILEHLETPGRVLKKREEDILKVPPIIWDNMFGGFIFAAQQASTSAESNPKEAREILDALIKDLQGIREFCMVGDKETNPPEIAQHSNS